VRPPHTVDVLQESKERAPHRGRRCDGKGKCSRDALYNWIVGRRKGCRRANRSGRLELDIV
jgi:hypothetical protein